MEQRPLMATLRTCAEALPVAPTQGARGSQTLSELAREVWVQGGGNRLCCSPQRPIRT